MGIWMSVQTAIVCLPDASFGALMVSKWLSLRPLLPRQQGDERACKRHGTTTAGGPLARPLEISESTTQSLPKLAVKILLRASRTTKAAAGAVGTTSGSSPSHCRAGMLLRGMTFSLGKSTWKSKALPRATSRLMPTMCNLGLCWGMPQALASTFLQDTR